MPIWSQILGELKQTAQDSDGIPNFDLVRRRYLARLHRHTGRNVILYASGWLQKSTAHPSSVSVVPEDLQGFMEVSHGLSGNDSPLDLVIHSPGGSIEAAEAIVGYLRDRFSDIRIIVPNLAMSAATMIACAGNVVVMGSHSRLGPTDPQHLLSTPMGERAVAAHDVLRQFDQARGECANSAVLPAWLPMLSQYGPDLLARCENSIKLANSLVELWLSTYMFAGEPNADGDAKHIADWLGTRGNHNSHGRMLARESLTKKGLKIEPLEADGTLQDLALSVFHATTHTFSGTPATKIMENHLGRAFVKSEPRPPPPPLVIQPQEIPQSP